jgi:SAM-dependent methyltransferase
MLATMSDYRNFRLVESWLVNFVEKIAIQMSTKNRFFKYSLFIKIFSPDDKTRILDVGIEDALYPWSNFLEEHYSNPHKITALSTEETKKFDQKYPLVKRVIYRGDIFPIKDQAFDIAWSNAVLEHVGNNAAQILFLKEIYRCSKRAFITTPNLYFPFELHTRIPFLHWLSKDTFDVFIRKIGKGWAAGDYMNLLSFSRLKKLLSEAGIKNYQIKRNRFGPFVMEFLVIF